MEKGKTYQQKRSEEKKHRIYQIAMEMFMEKGYENTTVRDICKAADITNSSFYNFFGDKLSVLLYFDYEILKSGDPFLKTTEENLKDPYQKVCDYIITTSVCFDEIGKELAELVLQSTQKLLNDRYDSLHRKSTTYQIAQYLETAQKHGYIPPSRNCSLDAEYLMMTATGITMYWLTLTNDDTYLDVASKLLPIAFSAITSDPVRIRIPTE
ncbi:MAG: TetR/AcrR family transcriptional regulator [Firmicutes bacterium]|nr:TetR/AcrR family transcriptional regulator [Bacillota bacterium]